MMLIGFAGLGFAGARRTKPGAAVWRRLTGNARTGIKTPPRGRRFFGAGRDARLCDGDRREGCGALIAPCGGPSRHRERKRSEPGGEGAAPSTLDRRVAPLLAMTGDSNPDEL